MLLQEQKTWDPSEGRDDLHNVNSTVPALCPPSTSRSAWLICRVDDLENMFKRKVYAKPHVENWFGKNDTDLNLPSSPGIDACSGSWSELQDGSHNKRCLRSVRQNDQLCAWNYSLFSFLLCICIFTFTFLYHILNRGALLWTLSFTIPKNWCTCVILILFFAAYGTRLETHVGPDVQDSSDNYWLATNVVYCPVIIPFIPFPFERQHWWCRKRTVQYRSSDFFEPPPKISTGLSFP